MTSDEKFMTQYVQVMVNFCVTVYLSIHDVIGDIFFFVLLLNLFSKYLFRLEYKIPLRPTRVCSVYLWSGVTAESSFLQITMLT